MMSKRAKRPPTVVVVERKGIPLGSPQTTPSRRRGRKNKKTTSRPTDAVLAARLVHGGGYARPSLASYRDTLTNPFNYGPVRLGWGTFAPTSLATAFRHFTGAPGAADNCFAVNAVPMISAGSTTADIPSHVKFSSYTSSNSIISLYSTVCLAATNASIIQSTAQTGRCVSMALRVTVRWPATALRGRLYGYFAPDDNGANYANLSVDQIIGLFGAKEFTGGGGNSATIEVQYRPIDARSFQMSGPMVNNGASPHSNATSVPQLIVVGTGFPIGNYGVDVQTILHMETQSGLDTAGEDSDSGTLASAGVTMDMAGAVTATVDPVKTSLTAIETLDLALQTAHRSLGRSGWGARGGFGTLVSASSFMPGVSTSAPPPTPSPLPPSHPVTNLAPPSPLFNLPSGYVVVNNV